MDNFSFVEPKYNVVIEGKAGFFLAQTVDLHSLSVTGV